MIDTYIRIFTMLIEVQNVITYFLSKLLRVFLYVKTVFKVHNTITIIIFYRKNNDEEIV